MNCTKCSNEMIEASATSFVDQYQYCHACKEEIAELYAQSSASTDSSEVKIAVIAPNLSWFRREALLRCPTGNICIVRQYFMVDNRKYVFVSHLNKLREHSFSEAEVWRRRSIPQNNLDTLLQEIDFLIAAGRIKYVMFYK